MALNKRLLQKVRDRIAEIPESYDQGWWANEDDEAPCGTSACIAGEALICSKRTVKAGLKFLWDTMKSDGYDVADKAQKLLGLTDEEAMTLFYTYWPEPYASRLYNAKGKKSRARAAVAYLDHIIKTGKVDE